MKLGTENFGLMANAPGEPTSKGETKKSRNVDHTNHYPINQNQRLLHKFINFPNFLTVAGLAETVKRLTAEREVAGSISRAGPIVSVLK